MTITIKVSAELALALKREAKDEDVEVCELVRDILAKHLDALGHDVGDED